MFAEFINAYGMELIATAITAIFGFFGLAAKNLYKKYADNQTKKDVVNTVVQGVEQLYKDLHGPEKLAKAMEAASEMLLEKGITVTEFELNMLIESAVGEFNDVFWKSGLVPAEDSTEKESE